jgi:hypothetical protein
VTAPVPSGRSRSTTGWISRCSAGKRTARAATPCSSSRGRRVRARGSPSSSSSTGGPRGWRSTRTTSSSTASAATTSAPCRRRARERPLRTRVEPSAFSQFLRVSA